MAGFTGVVQLRKDLGVRPQLGWAIAEEPRIDRLLERVRAEAQTRPPLPSRPGELMLRALRGFPGDICKFHATFGGVVFDCGVVDGKKLSVRFLAADALRPVFDGASCNSELDYLCEQGIIEAKAVKERRTFIDTYSQLTVFAWIFGTRGAYAFGGDPDGDDRGGNQIFLWDGGHAPESFLRVADSFADWLEELLDTKRPPRERRS